jgi:hypothetical protein
MVNENLLRTLHCHSINEMESVFSSYINTDVKDEPFPQHISDTMQALPHDGKGINILTDGCKSFVPRQVVGDVFKQPKTVGQKYEGIYDSSYEGHKQYEEKKKDE